LFNKFLDNKIIVTRINAFDAKKVFVQIDGKEKIRVKK